MHLVSPKPLNSEIEVVSDFSRTVISWKNSRGGSGRFLSLLFMLAWLGGWAVGEYAAASAVFGGDWNPFIIFWLIGWTVGGVFVMRQIYFLARPAKPEKIILDATSLIFEVGTSPLWSESNRRKDDDDALPAYSESKYIVSKNDLGEIKLQRVGERQRLTFDYGAERVEVGFFLKEPEREWLYSVLKQWRGGRPKRRIESRFGTT